MATKKRRGRPKSVARFTLEDFENEPDDPSGDMAGQHMDESKAAEEADLEDEDREDLMRDMGLDPFGNYE